MLGKIIKITRVGKFADYAASGDTTFRKLTLIHGENGRGKSTLAAILRSLRTGEAVHIVERTTLNRLGDPEVQLLWDNKRADFTKGNWTCPPHQIEIFDTKFIYDNVYVGDSVDHEHKKNLYKVIVGEEGVKLSHKVDELDEGIKAANAAIRVAQAAVEATIENKMPIKSFLKLAKLNDVDQQISTQEQQIAALKNADQIATKGLFAIVSLPTIPDSFTDTLGKTLDDLSQEAETAITEHISEHLDEAGEQWLQTGYDYLGDGTTCPFCSQDVKGNTLIAAYRAHFSESYSGLKATIERLSTTISSTFGSDALLAVQQTISGNATLLEFWSRFVPTTLVELSFDPVAAGWKKLQQSLEERVAKKAASPLDEIAIDAACSQVMGAFETLRDETTRYNDSCTAANAKITAKKTQVATGDLKAALQRLSDLCNAKARHTSDVAALCTMYQASLGDKEKLDIDKQTAKDALDLYANKTFTTYQAEINKLLMKFGADFQIVNTSRSFVGGKASSSYEIQINSVNVPLDDGGTAGTPCFKNTLSGGDRSALALAFFLVQLQHDKDLPKKCVVFDDPVCSLDKFRMSITVQEVKRIADKAKQTVVMCHDPFFLRKLWELSPPTDVKTLHLERQATDTVVSEWDIERATQSQYFQDYASLAMYLQSGPSLPDLRDYARKIRPLLEENLRVRFPDCFDKGWLGEFLKAIREAKPGETLERLQTHLPDLDDLNNYSKKYHHSENPIAATEPIVDAELSSHVTRTLAFIRGA